MAESADDNIKEALRVLRERRAALDDDLDVERGTRVSKWASGVAAAAALAGIVGATASALTDNKTLDILGLRDVEEVRTVLDKEVVRSLGTLQGDVAALRKAQAAIVRLPPGDKAGVQLVALNAKLEVIEQRQARLEQALDISPEKALAMPLLRRDIDNMRESNTQNLAAIKANVDQVYDLTKWLLGALAVGVFSLAIATFFGKK